MAELEPAIPKLPQQGPLPLHQQSLDLNVRSSHQPIAVEGKETTIHDFFSLGGSNSTSSSVDVGPKVLQSSIPLQDLLHPQQKSLGISNVLPAVLVHGISKPHVSAGRQSACIFVNEGVEMQPNHRTSDISHVPKAHGPHDVPNNKHWQQQKKKRLSWVMSEDDEDEDDECVDPGYNSKKENGHQKFDDSQQPEGRIMDSKELTPRSKHSATEQRRRSRINDRFQMLRQLLPYSDQKRDKASFLMEVIEHIHMLHEKVKTYEAAEHLCQPQEKPKALSWDRTSGCREGVIDVLYGQPVMYNTKDKPDANGYVSYQSSPLRVDHRNDNAQIELNSNGAHASPSPNRLLQVPACLASYGNSLLISTPAVLNFATPLGIYEEEPVTPTLFPSSSQLLPESHSMFARLVHQGQQAALMGKHSHSNEKTVALPDLHQAGILMSAQQSSFRHENDCEKLKIPGQMRLLTHSDPRTKDHETDNQLRSSPEKDMFQRNANSASKECEVHKGRTALDASQMDVNARGPKGDPCGEVVTNKQAQSAALNGSVTVSSPYSQTMLDALTRALQRSGVNLSQASISVQINLGKSSGSAITREIATLNTTMVPLQNIKVGHAEEPEFPISKRPKLEAD